MACAHCQTHFFFSEAGDLLDWTPCVLATAVATSAWSGCSPTVSAQRHSRRREQIVVDLRMCSRGQNGHNHLFGSFWLTNQNARLGFAVPESTEEANTGGATTAPKRRKVSSVHMTSYPEVACAANGTELTLVQCYDVSIGVVAQLNEFTCVVVKRRCWVLHHPRDTAVVQLLDDGTRPMSQRCWHSLSL